MKCLGCGIPLSVILKAGTRFCSQTCRSFVYRIKAKKLASK